jgi:hypothetical protein
LIGRTSSIDRLASLRAAAPRRPDAEPLRERQRGPAVDVHGARVGAAVEQQPDHVKTTAVGRDHERRVARGRPGVDRRPAVEENLGDIPVAELRRKHQRCEPETIGGVR